MRLKISSGFVRVCLTAVAVGIAAPAFAGDLSVQVAQTRDDIISGLSTPAEVPAVRGKGDVRGLNVTGLRLPVVFGPGLWYRGAAAEIVDLFQAAADGGAASSSATPSG